MITAKLSSYTHEEVDKMLEVAIKARRNLCNPDCESSYQTTVKCANCKYSHVCYDMSSLIDYLFREQHYNYPHSKK